jgi:hypothetical protein
MAYEKKEWSMEQLCAALNESDIDHGWAVDETQEVHRHVLYVELPTGQVSFHTEKRLLGPEFSGRWDGIRDVASERIVSFANSILGAEEKELPHAQSPL